MSDSPKPPPNDGPKAPGAVLAPALGLGVVLAQLLLAWALSGQPDVGKAYRSLFRFDSLLYAEIVDDGYVCPPSFPRDHGNVSFFPAYPLSGWLVRTVTGWPTPIALLVAAQLAAWGTWTYVFLLLRQWRLSGKLAVLGFVLLASRPTAFFLVAAYSEPLFLMNLLGFVYWSGVKSRAAPFLAALHGFVLSATRISGLPVASYPVVYAWLNTPKDRPVRLLPALAVAAFAALGAGLFFLYCHVRFGYWDLYMRTQFLGWRVQPDYLAFFEGDTYLLLFPTSLEDYFQANYFSRFCTFLLLPVFAGFLAAEYRLARSDSATGWRERAGMYLAAWLVYYLSVSGTSRLGLVSMARYVLVPEMLLMLCLVHMLARRSLPSGRLPTWLRVSLAAWVLYGFAAQLVCTWRYTHGWWVG